jgi:hypothetical protein
MHTITKTLTIAGKKYRLSTRTYDDYIDLNGPGIVGGICLPAGVTLDSPDLREMVAQAVADYWERHRRASEWIQQRVRAGLA